MLCRGLKTLDELDAAEEKEKQEREEQERVEQDRYATIAAGQPEAAAEFLSSFDPCDPS
jgi:ribosomal 50S subunit-associated protein YjgA (DUF615 family)